MVTFPPEIELHDPSSNVSVGQPVGMVADIDTFVRVGTKDGQLLRVDIKDGVTTIQNSGGDGQPFGGICLDSRGDTTLYAPGHRTGMMFAFDEFGRRVRTYQLDAPNSVLLTSCIQTQYQLIVIDSQNSQLFYMPLSDDSQDGRGDPAPTDEFEGQPYQGYKVRLGGDWKQAKGAPINAFGVEWTQNFQRTTAFIMNSATGLLYSIRVSPSGVDGDSVRLVNVTGEITTFPGCMSIRFDSSDESVLYLTMPTINAIAVVEVEDDKDKEVKQAKFIRYIQSPLTNGPIGLGEYGDYLYAISWKPQKKGDHYTMARLPRYRPVREEGETFTSAYDGTVSEPDPVDSTNDVWANTVEDPPESGREAPEEVSPDAPPPSPSASATPSASASVDPISATPVSVPTDENEPAEVDNPPEIFSGEEPPRAAEEGGSCFPSEATVELRDGSTVRMDALEIGDYVRSSDCASCKSGYSRVYAFSHQDGSARAEFISLRLSNDETLSLTGGHFLYCNGKLVAARGVKIGDEIVTQDGQHSNIVSIERTVKHGLYNPHTLSGNIFVNGLLTSTFTETVDPVIASALMAPLRAADRSAIVIVNKWLSSVLRFGSSGLFAYS